jgi:hypothetical protein
LFLLPFGISITTSNSMAISIPGVQVGGVLSSSA